MNMVTMSSLLFDPDGYFVLKAENGSDISSISRRVNRVATLDGGAAINDFGLSHADRTLSIVVRLTPGLDKRLLRLCELHGRLICTTNEACFLVAFESISRTDESTATLNLLVLRKLTP
jgi:hypothetical protein